MAKSSPRQYTNLTLKRLFSLSGNRCAFPDCTQIFLNWEDETNFANICHIEDANPTTHKSDRYNPNMTNKERADYKNLILLCPNHHIETNDPAKYSVIVVQKMKRDHESKMALLQAGKNIIAKHPAILSIVINQIGETLIENDLDDNTKTAPSTDEKILYNNIINYKPIIEEYSIYQGKLNNIYEEIENQGSTKKAFLLQNLKTLYLKEKGKYKDISEIRANADLIFENIENDIWEILERSSNLNNQLPIETLNIAILIVMVDAFMRCKILEEPIKQ